MPFSQLPIRVFRKSANRLRYLLVRPRIRRLTGQQDFNGYRRVYHAHMRKTGGTSINHIFLGLGTQDTESLYSELCDRYFAIRGKKVYAAWNPRILAEGHYFYGHSHWPLHELRLPEDTFIFSCFRDPVKRLVSLYRMLEGNRRKGVQNPGGQDAWLGEGFGGFVDRLPKSELLGQIYMFSSTYSVEEAVQAAGAIEHIMFTEEFDAGLRALARKTGLPLEPIHMRKSPDQVEVPAGEVERLRERTAPEYAFLSQLREQTGQGG